MEPKRGAIKTTVPLKIGNISFHVSLGECKKEVVCGRIARKRFRARRYGNNGHVSDDDGGGCHGCGRRKTRGGGGGGGGAKELALALAPAAAAAAALVAEANPLFKTLCVHL